MPNSTQAPISGENVKKAIEWSMEQLKAQPYRRHENDWNASETILAEQWNGYVSAGATVYRCNEEATSWNVDYDNRCECCGTLSDMGSEDFTADTLQEVADKLAEHLSKNKGCNCLL